MSSDNIKDALQKAFPNTSPKDWKRRSKTKEGDRTRRDFEHAQHGKVTTWEAADGSVTLDGLKADDIGDLRAALDKGGVDAARAIVEKMVATYDPATGPTVAMTATGIAYKPVAAPYEEGLGESITRMGQELVRDMAARVDEIINPEQIRDGDRIRIPVGTTIYRYSDYEGGSLGGRRVLDADEEQTVIGIVGVADFLSMARPATCIKIAKRMTEVDEASFPGVQYNVRYGANSVRPTEEEEAFSNIKFLTVWLSEKHTGVHRNRPYYYQRDDALKALVEEARLEVIEDWGDAPRFVMWGMPHVRKVAKLDDVFKIADKSQFKLAAAPKKKEKAITKRRLMVEKSTWRFDKDAVVSMWIRNPKIDEMLAKRDAQPHRGGQYGTGAVADACQAEINRLSKEEPQINVPVFSFAAGTVIEVVGSLTADGMFNYGSKSETNGLLVPFKVVSGKAQFLSGIRSMSDTGIWGGLSVPYKQIENLVEAESIPETISWVLRDRETGDFFGGWQSETITYESGYSSNRQTNEPKMS